MSVQALSGDTHQNASHSVTHLQDSLQLQNKHSNNSTRPSTHNGHQAAKNANDEIQSPILVCSNFEAENSHCKTPAVQSRLQRTSIDIEEKQRSLDNPLVINITYTQYEIIHEVAAFCNLRTSVDEEEDWDIWFIDGPVLPTLLQKMRPYQRTNHFPGMYAMARKNLLAKNLLSMQKYFTSEYQFFPPTWMLPADIKNFKEQFNERKAKTFIIKPEDSCQGKGIFLTRNYDWINVNEHYVAQRYLHKPYLIDGLKFDLRVYVLITSVTPLRFFIYREGLARFATSEYVAPVGSNLGNLFMHLTNYAINKDSENFQQNEGHDDKGHKRSLTSIFNHIDEAAK